MCGTIDVYCERGVLVIMRKKEGKLIPAEVAEEGSTDMAYIGEVHRESCVEQRIDGACCSGLMQLH